MDINVHPKIGTKLYKYKSMATPEQKAHVEDILLANRLFFPKRHFFNDPFDCHIPISWNITEEELVKKLLEVYREEGSRILAESVEQYVQDRVKDGTITEITQTNIAYRAVEAVLDKCGILCLSERRDDILMWSQAGISL